MINLTEQDIKWYNEGQDISAISHIADDDIVMHNIDDRMLFAISLYDLLFKYGLLDLFNKPKSPWQDGFKKFMDTKGDDKCIFIYQDSIWKLKIVFSQILPAKGVIAKESITTTITLPTEMLTGYIIQYLGTDR